MITPLPEASSLARLTLFPGESSKRSTLGIESPCLTYWALKGGNVNNVPEASYLVKQAIQDGGVSEGMT